MLRRISRLTPHPSRCWWSPWARFCNVLMVPPGEAAVSGCTHRSRASFSTSPVRRPRQVVALALPCAVALLLAPAAAAALADVERELLAVVECRPDPFRARLASDPLRQAGPHARRQRRHRRGRDRDKWRTRHLGRARLRRVDRRDAGAQGRGRDPAAQPAIGSPGTVPAARGRHVAVFCARLGSPPPSAR